ncbi:MAG: glycerophosphodiester phosphodiesterase, partial [Lachnospiraceae bacterium]|nr:glycerophosphodiester phosphodiesterase [Lachnospiraceae bacterium]
GNAFNTCRELVKRLDNYEGTYCIESFDPRVVHWFKVNRPEILRGQLSDNFGRKKRRMNPVEWMMANLLFNSYAKPDFISFNHKYKNMFSYKLARKLFNFENAAWTIKNQEQLDNAKDVFNIMIFDSFIPERGKSDE